MVYAQTRIRPWEWDIENSLGYWNTNRSPNPVQNTRPRDSKLKKRTCRIVDLADHRVKIKENEKRAYYLDLSIELKRYMEYESDGHRNSKWCTRNDPQMFGKWARRLGNRKTSWDHPNYTIAKIGQNTMKSPGNLRRLAVTQTPVKGHQLTLV